MHVPFLELEYQHEPIKEELHEAIDNVVRSNQFILGPFVEKFERDVAEYCGIEYAIGVSSGTDALLVSLMALGITSDDYVMTTPFSFFATAGVIARLGATPIFVDIDPDTFSLSAEALTDTWSTMSDDVKRRTQAIIPVHLFGQCADMTPIMDFARAHDIPVIEDAAQSIGAEYPDVAIDGTRKAGTIGQMGCYSFFPSKNLGGFGDGGLVTTSNSDVAERIRMLRAHGARPKYYHHYVGGNFRLDAIQAAVLSVKLPHLDTWHRERRANAQHYNELFTEKGLTDVVTLPASSYENQRIEFPHIFNQYVIRTAQRDALREHLSACNVATAIYYPLPLHRQPCFADLGYDEGSFPASEQAAQEVLALPVYPGMRPEQRMYVVESIEEFYR